MSALTEVVAPVAQILAAIAAAVAATAAWHSATAAKTTAGLADETSRRAAEALSRATLPVLAVTLTGGSSSERGPQALELYLRNDSPNPGVIKAVKLEASDGTARCDGTGLPKPIGSQRSGVAADNVCYVPLGLVDRLHPEAQGSAGADKRFIFTVEFTDAHELGTWRLRGEIVENIGITVANGDIPARSMYSYSLWEHSYPEIVRDDVSSSGNQ